MIIDIEYIDGIYNVMFFDNGGMSVLSKTKNHDVAKRKAKKFKKYLREGRLLKPEKSIWKY